jgi:ribosomal-protein-alanine N-acetyltransferase
MAGTEIVVRPAQAGDVGALETVAKQSGLSFEAARDLSRPFLVVLVASVDEQVVGFLSMQRMADEAEILDLGVLTSHRRQGVGARLLEAARKSARDSAVVELFLEVRRGNQAALALYEGSGFSQVGERKRYYRDGEDALLLRTLLEDTA